MVTTILTNKNVVSRTFHFFTLIALTLLISVSCSKEKDTPTVDGARLTISVSGIAESEVIKPGRQSVGKSVALSTNSNQQILKLDNAKVGEFSIEVNSVAKSINATQNVVGGKNRAAKSMENNTGRAGSVSMESGVKYQIILRNKATGVFEKATTAVAGTNTDISVKLGQEYDWYAISYNNTDDIAQPNLANPVVESKTDQPFLFASGSVTVSSEGSTPIAITFDHQLAQILVEVDSRGVYGDIANLAGSFSENYVKTGTFDLVEGTFVGELSAVDVGDIAFEYADASNKKQKRARYYTADTELSSYTVQFSAMDIQLTTGEEVSLSPLPNGGLITFGDYATPAVGKVLHGWLDLWKVFPKKTILHLEESTSYSYAASNPDRASGAFLRNPLNFGVNSQYLRVDGFEHIVDNASGGALSRRLSNPQNYPDIIIAAPFGVYNTNDYNALATYLEKGGVVFIFTESSSNNIQAFLRKVLKQEINTNRHDRSGAVYQLLEQNDGNIYASPFGNVTGKLWGQDRSSTLFIEGYTGNDVYVYTRSSRNRRPQNGITMFRHKTLNLFFAGDTGFLANNERNGSGVGGGNTSEPFATDANDFPVDKPRFGVSGQTGSLDQDKPAGSWAVSNSLIFANEFANMLAQSHYQGIDRN